MKPNKPEAAPPPPAAKVPTAAKAPAPAKGKADPGRGREELSPKIHKLMLFPTSGRIGFDRVSWPDARTVYALISGAYLCAAQSRSVFRFRSSTT